MLQCIDYLNVNWLLIVVVFCLLKVYQDVVMNALHMEKILV